MALFSSFSIHINSQKFRRNTDKVSPEFFVYNGTHEKLFKMEVKVLNSHNLKLKISEWTFLNEVILNEVILEVILNEVIPNKAILNKNIKDKND